MSAQMPAEYYMGRVDAVLNMKKSAEATMSVLPKDMQRLLTLFIQTTVSVEVAAIPESYKDQVRGVCGT